MTKKQHDKAVNKIALKPEIVGIEGAILACQETSVFRNGVLITQADNIIFDAYGQIHVVEYKSTHYTDKAIEQLHKSSGVIQEYFGIKPVLWYVEGKKLKCKEVR